MNDLMKKFTEDEQLLQESFFIGFRSKLKKKKITLISKLPIEFYELMVVLFQNTNIDCKRWGLMLNQFSKKFLDKYHEEEQGET